VCQSSSALGLPLSIDNSASTGTKVKIEREQHNSEGTGHARISPDLASVLKRAAGIEDMELGNAENSAVHGECLYVYFCFVFILICDSDYTEGFGLEMNWAWH
jgi:hypothetical protein